MKHSLLDTRDRCDTCGRFVRPFAPGVSWSQSYTFMTLNDMRYRCSPCTDEHGIEPSNCNPAAGPWCGRNPQRAETGG